MTWARIDDSFIDHEKIVALDLHERWLLTASIILGNRLLALNPDRPGFLSDAQVRALARQQGCRAKAISGLVERGCWERAEGGIHIHDFEDYLDPDWRQKLEKRAQISEMKRRFGAAGGKASVEARRAAYGSAQPGTQPSKQTPKQTPKQPPKQNEAFASDGAADSPKQTPKHPQSPVPVPVRYGDIATPGVERESLSRERGVNVLEVAPTKLQEWLAGKRGQGQLSPEAYNRNDLMANAIVGRAAEMGMEEKRLFEVLDLLWEGSNPTDRPSSLRWFWTQFQDIAHEDLKTVGRPTSRINGLSSLAETLMGNKASS
jgi:hypothetical protein